MRSREKAIELCERILANSGHIKDIFSYFEKRKGQEFWLVGSAVWETLISCYYSKKPAEPDDFDFVLKHPFRNFRFPDRWSTGFNKFGESKCVKYVHRPLTEEEKKVWNTPREDEIPYVYKLNFVPLERWNVMKRLVEKGVPCTIQNLASGFPLDINDLYYSFKYKRIRGKGTAAIERRVITVKDVYELHHAAETANKSDAAYLESMRQRAVQASDGLEWKIM